MTHLMQRFTPSQRIVIVGVLVAAFILSGLALVLSSPGEKDAERASAVDPVAQAAIPPIDAAAPANVETATFALG